MDLRRRRLFGLVAFAFLAALVAFALMMTLLLVGVTPHLLFSPGFFVKAQLTAVGIHAPNVFGVLVTGLVWWAAVVLAWLGIRAVVTRVRGARSRPS